MWFLSRSQIVETVSWGDHFVPLYVKYKNSRLRRVIGSHRKYQLEYFYALMETTISWRPRFLLQRSLVGLLSRSRSWARGNHVLRQTSSYRWNPTTIALLVRRIFGRMKSTLNTTIIYKKIERKIPIFPYLPSHNFCPKFKIFVWFASEGENDG